MRSAAQTVCRFFSLAPRPQHFFTGRLRENCELFLEERREMAFNQNSAAVAAMEEESANVVHLSGMQHQGEKSGHRCGFSCTIQHVWANLYLCKSTGTSHVCDKNCDQRIVYDNHSSICRASRQIFPLQQAPHQGMRRKHRECEGFEVEALTKRNRCFVSQEQMNMAVGFASPYQDMPHCTAQGESAMDVA